MEPTLYMMSPEPANTFLATWADANFYERHDKKDEAAGKVIKKEKMSDQKQE